MQEMYTEFGAYVHTHKGLLPAAVVRREERRGEAFIDKMIDDLAIYTCALDACVRTPGIVNQQLIK
jgi:hypothetical protein